MTLFPSASKQPLRAPPLPTPNSRWAVLLDVDGSLLDFADDARSVTASSSLLDLLQQLHQALDGALALISSRNLRHIDSILGRARWAAAGFDGLELRHADGSFRRNTPTDASQTQMREAVTSLVARFEGVRMEDKQLSILLHYDSDAARFARLHVEALGLLAQLPGYELQRGGEGLEFKPRGMDKGQAVRELLRHPVFAGRQPIYLGCGIRDEQAFRRVNRMRGYSVRIGQRDPTLAHYTLPDPMAARAWLGQALDALSASASAPSHPIQPPDAG